MFGKILLGSFPIRRCLDFIIIFPTFLPSCRLDFPIKFFFSRCARILVYFPIVRFTMNVLVICMSFL